MGPLQPDLPERALKTRRESVRSASENQAVVENACVLTPRRGHARRPRALLSANRKDLMC